MFMTPKPPFQPRGPRQSKTCWRCGRDLPLYRFTVEWLEDPGDDEHPEPMLWKYSHDECYECEPELSELAQLRAGVEAWKQWRATAQFRGDLHSELDATTEILRCLKRWVAIQIRAKARRQVIARIRPALKSVQFPKRMTWQ